MADDLFALADLLKINDISLADIEVTDLRNEAPLMMRIPYTPATHGTIHKYTKETQAPVVGFRAANAGRAFDSSVDDEVTATLVILDWSFLVDKAVADAYVRGGRNAFIGREGRRHLRAAFFAYEQQLIYGTTSDGDASGFTGFANVLDDLDDTMVHDAGGTTDDTASSIWLIREGEDDIIGVLGNDGVFDMGESVTVNHRTADSPPKNFPAYYTPGTGYTGVQVGGAYSLGRIANVTADSGKTCTDDLIAEGLALFPASKLPTVLAMSRRSVKQLRASRTATNATGAPAPWPTESFGIPIVSTDAIIDTEALVTT